MTMVPDSRRRRQIRASVAFLSLVFFLATPDRGSAQSLRPLATEDAAVLPSGHTQFTLGTSYFRNRRWPAFTPTGFLSSQDVVTAPELEARIGAGGWVEIQIQYDLIYLDEEHHDGGSHSKFGTGDARLFTKVHLVGERKWWPDLGIRFGVKLPNANRVDRLGTDEADFEIAALASKNLGPATVHANLGVQILGNPGALNGDPDESASGQDDLFLYSIGVASNPLFTAHTGPYTARLLAEIRGLAGSRFDNDGAAARLGLQVQRDAWTVYFGGSAGLMEAAEKYGVLGGVIYAFDLARLAAFFEDRSVRDEARAGSSTGTHSTISKP
jgi:hypothetical protein